MGALVALVLAVAVTTADQPARAASSVPGGYRVVSEHFVDSGATHVRLRRESPAQDVHVARLAPQLAGRLRVMTAHDQVAGPSRYETTSGMCLRVRCMLAVNGDYTELSSYGSVGSVVSGGELIRTEGRRMALLSLDGRGKPSIDHSLPWSVALDVPGRGPVLVSRVNRPRPAGSLVMFTPRFGPSTLTSADGRELVLELPAPELGAVPAHGTEVRIAALHVGGDVRIGPGRVVLSGQGDGARVIEELWHRAVTFGERSATLHVTTGGAVEVVGGSPTLVRGGRRDFPDNADDFTRNRHPRTMIGWTASGELLLATVDGRQPGHSEGMSLAEASELLIGLGAVEAMNLDGGGSTTFVVNSRVVNRPSNAGHAERRVTSALVLLPVPGTVATAAVRSTEDACPPREVQPAGFTDVPPTNPHSPAIDCAVWWTLSSGTGPGTFSPSREVSRGQMASFIARLVNESGGALPKAPRDHYRDDERSVHETNINRLAEVGIVSGRSDGTYGPDAPVTRAQMATLLMRAYEHRTGKALAPTADYFADDANDVHEASINRLAFGGITGGKRHAHLYAPGEWVLREQMASFLTRTMSLLVSEGHTNPR